MRMAIICTIIWQDRAALVVSVISISYGTLKFGRKGGPEVEITHALKYPIGALAEPVWPKVYFPRNIFLGSEDRAGSVALWLYAIRHTQLPILV